MENKEISLQTILDVMNSRFEKIDKRLDAMDRRFDGIDARLDAMDARLDGIDARLDGMDARLDAMDARLDAMDARLDGIDARLYGMDARLDGIDARLDAMDARITKIDADNKEAHEKILEELQKQGNTLTKIEAEFGNKIAILFDANEYARDRMHLFGNQQLRFAEKLEKLSYQIPSAKN